MVGTRLLVAGSFALPFGLLTALSIYFGIPRDDLIWKRLEALSFISSSPPPGVFPPPSPPSDEDLAIAGLISPGKKPMLVVPTSWTVNEMEQVLYDVIPRSESELAELCQNHHHQHDHHYDQHHNRDDDQLRRMMPLERQATIVLCRGGVVDGSPTTTAKVVARQNYIYLYSKSKREFRQMLQSYDDHSSYYQEQPRMTMSGGGTRVRLVLDRSDLLHSDWKEITNHLVSWVRLTLPSNSNACRNVDNVSIELDVMDDPNVVGQQRTPRDMLDLLDDTPIDSNNSNNINKVILYLTSTDQAQAFHGQLGAVDFCLGPGRYLYIVHDHSTMLAAVRDGFQRIILHDCWNLPYSIDGRDNDEGLQTLYQVYNATMARRVTHQLQEKARWLQYRIDHLHSTASVSSNRKSSRNKFDGDIQQQAVRKLLHRGRFRETREMVDSVRFGMVPDFPYDQYAAIFAPLLFPLLIPAVLTTFREVKRYRKTRHNTA
jgi:Phosphatidylinositol-glycan biosynthesis class S protein